MPLTSPIILLLGISRLIPSGHGPFLDHLKDLGWRTLVCAENIDHRLRSKAWKVISTPPSSLNDVLKAVEGLEIAAILPLSDDVVTVGAALGEIFNLAQPSRSACELIRSKASLKERLQLHGIPTPSYETGSFEALSSGLACPSLPAPWIIKPSCSEGGSTGVFAASSQIELIRRLNEDASGYERDEVLIEPLLKGTEHSMEVIVRNGRTKIISISDKYNYPGHPSVVQNLVFPGPVGWMHFFELRSIVERLPSALGVQTGTMHIEFIVTQTGPWLIDLSLRPGGSYNLHPIPLLSTGYDYVNILASMLAGSRKELLKEEPLGFVAWHFFDPCLLTEKSLATIDYLRGEADVIAIELLKHPGTMPTKLLADADRPGYALVTGSNPLTAMKRAQELASRLYS